MNSVELTRHLVDLLIMTVGVGVLLYAVSRPTVRRSFFHNRGRYFLMIGTAIFVFTHWTSVIGSFALPALFDVPQPESFGGGIPSWLFWLLSRGALLLILAGLSMAIWERKRLEHDVSTSRDLIKDAQYSIEQSEARFRYLFETTSNSIFCYTFDPPMPINLTIDEQVRRSHHAVLTECNEVFAKALVTLSPAAVIGTKMGMLDGNKDAEAHYEYFKSFIENDYRLTDYELIYKTPGGQERAVKSSLTGIVKDGLLLRFWGAESNILDIRRTRTALANRRRYQGLLAAISSRLVTTPNERADDVIEQCMIELCQFFGADRTALIWYEQATEQVEIFQSFTAEGTRYEAPVSLATFPKTAELLLNNVVVRVNNCESPPAAIVGDREIFLQRGLKSFIALPLAVDGDVIGVSTYANTEERRSWTQQEVMDLRVFAELFASYIFRLKSRRALDEALRGLQRATDRLEAENVYLRQEFERTHGFDEIIGQSDAIVRCLHMVEQVADTMAPVLLLGETGTGKELFARAIHEHSSRRDRPLVKVNCAALPAELIESELFGYERGAFTGAEKAKRGRFDLADGSTLFLDEIGDIPLELQAKLLRVLQEGEIERLGGSNTIKVDVRIIAATNRNLTDAVSDGEFRSDLFYRINTFPIELPPLRDREDDIQMLAEHFVHVHSKGFGRDVGAISAEMMRQLREYSWPGNVRELDGVIQRAMISSTASVLELAEPLVERSIEGSERMPHVVSTTIADLRIVEREHIISVLKDSDWRIAGKSGAADKLGMPPSTLRSKMKKLAIERPH